MAKSRKRDGQKAHNRRIRAIKQKVNAQKTAMQKMFEESMQQQIEEMKKKQEQKALESEQTPQQ